MRRGPTLLFIAVLMSYASAAQMSTLPAARAIANLPGPPKNPPIFSEMTIILEGGLQFENALEMKGPVASVEREETQTTDQNPHPYHTITKLKFDDDGHLIESIFEDSNGAQTTSNVWVKGKLQSQNVHHHRNNAQYPDSDEWQRWSYDKDGRLSEFTAGRDKAEFNYYLNFKYDDNGRPLGYEYRDSKLGGPPVLTEISYSGKTITLSRLDGKGRKFFEQAQTVDSNGRVIGLKVSDISGGELKQWYHVTFKYDGKNRVVEQSTDPFKLGSGDDYSPIPGKLVVEYDDEKHSGEQKFFDTDGKAVLHTTFEFDHDEIFTKLRVLDSAGKEKIGSEIFVDAQYKSSTRPGNVEWQVTYDDQGNWTDRRRWFSPADGSPRIMTRLIHQKITYR